MNTNFMNLVNDTLDRLYKQKKIITKADFEIIEYLRLAIKRKNILNIVMFNMYGKLMIKNIIKTIRILTQFEFSPPFVFDNDKNRFIDYDQISFDYKLEYKIKILSECLSIRLQVIPIINGEIYENKYLEIKLNFMGNCDLIVDNDAHIKSLGINYSYSNFYKYDLIQKMREMYDTMNKQQILSHFITSTSVYLKMFFWEKIPKELYQIPNYKFKRSCCKESEFYSNRLFSSIPDLSNFDIKDHNDHYDNLAYYDSNYLRSFKRYVTPKHRKTDRCFVRLLTQLISNFIVSMNNSSFVEYNDKKYLFNSLKCDKYVIKKFVKNIEKFKMKIKKETKTYEKIL